MFVQAIENQIFRKMAPLAIRHLKKPDLKTSNPLAERALSQAAREFQIAPPLTIHLADPELLAGLWRLMREAYVVDAGGRARREAVAAAVSKLNECPYCVTVHAGMFDGAGQDSRLFADPSRLPAGIREAYAFAAATLSPGSEALTSPAIAPADQPQIFATAFTYHYVNRMVSVFLGETPVALPGMTSAPGRKLAQASLGFFGRRIVRIDPQPGQCAVGGRRDLPGEFLWAAPDPHIAGALAHFAHAAEEAGRESAPPQVRSLVLKHLASWRGERSLLSRGWLEELVAPLDDGLKPAARLALLAARAAYQVDDGIVQAFSKTAPGDRALLQIVAWASFAAARRIASWLPGHEQAAA
jgi:AhpD family alkylhydroperoxidase